MEDVESSIPARFEKIVRLYPERLAVRTQRRQLNYMELNEAANRVAWAILARRGTGRAPVALLLPKGVELVVAILAVLKAGKIFVVLDPALPPSRIHSLLNDSEASLVLANEPSRSVVNSVAPEVVWLDLDAVDAMPSGIEPLPHNGPDDLAYILYTSGSTGVPKAIIENHRNLLHYIKTQTDALHICAEDRLTFLASQGRDIFRAVLNGAAVYPVDIKRDGVVGLARLLIEQRISIFNSVASAFREFVATLTGKEKFPDLRVIQLMGEPVYRTDVALHRAHFDRRCILVNCYGPNDAGVLTRYLVDDQTTILGSGVPVGYSVDGKNVFVVDDNDNELPFGQTGEIATSSRYLPPGYWRRPELTSSAFKFVSADGTERFYRTGDIGSMAPDGCLIYLGRKDSQVKIRGNKVEIAEVEMELLRVDGITEAAVVAIEEAPGEKRLIAYLVTTIAPDPSAADLRQRLAAKLPDYMIPSAFVVLDKLPVTGIGKIDRAALPAPNHQRPSLGTPYAPPQSRTEVELARMWSEVLGVEVVGIHDDFFALGGHSLAASRVITRVIRTFQLELPIKALFDAPTVAEMAKVIEQHESKRANDEMLVRMLAEIEAMTEEEAQRLLSKN